MGSNMYRFKENKLFFQNNTSLFQALKYWEKRERKRHAESWQGRKKEKGRRVCNHFFYDPGLERVKNSFL